MNNFIFKKIPQKDEKQDRNLLNIISEIEIEDFFIPWTEEQINRFFDEDYSILFGAYDNDKLIAMCQILHLKK